MKVIFLDIDGVLNNEVFVNAFWAICKQVDLKRSQAKALHKIVMRDDYGNLFCPTATNMLNYILEETGAKIVISSTWRFMGEKEIKQMWIDRGLKGEIIGVTPHLPSRLRGQEIEDWLEWYKSENQDDIQYVIIDDDKDMLPHQMQNFVQTDPFYGITFNDAIQAIKILNQ